MHGEGQSICRLWWCILVVAVCVVSSGCGEDSRIRQSAEIWNQYVNAIRSGDSQIAASFFTPESRHYFRLDSAKQSDYATSEFTITKIELDGSYNALQILQENSKGKSTIYKYLIPHEGSYRLQYPFFIFAANWPTMASPHFIVHSRIFASPPVFDDSTGEAVIYNPDILERFYTEIKNLTGSTGNDTIDYYFCRDGEEVGLLSGQISAAWAVFGPCVISTEKYDLADVTRAIIDKQKRPCDLLYFGLLGYGELERARVENAPTEDVDAATAKHVERLKTKSLSDFLRNPDGLESEDTRKDMYYIGGAMVKYLIDTYGPDKFRDLYQSSETADEFETQLSLIYDVNLSQIEDRLRSLYKPFFQSQAHINRQ